MGNKTQNNTRKGLIQTLSISTIAVFAIVGVIAFSPLATQFGEDGSTRGSASMAEIDSLMLAREYKNALNVVDSCIMEKSQDLPRLAYFDRFMSEEKRYEASVNRAEIYDLQWARINILKQMDEKKALAEALEDYCGIIGYNQEQAKEMLIQLKGE